MLMDFVHPSHRIQTFVLQLTDSNPRVCWLIHTISLRLRYTKIDRKSAGRAFYAFSQLWTLNTFNRTLTLVIVSQVSHLMLCFVYSNVKQVWKTHRYVWYVCIYKPHYWKLFYGCSLYLILHYIDLLKVFILFAIF